MSALDFHWHFLWLRVYLYLSMRFAGYGWWAHFFFARYWYFGQACQEARPVFTKAYFDAKYAEVLESWRSIGLQ